MSTLAKQPIITYAESTPNPAAMKFVANKMLLENPVPLEFFKVADAKSSPLAQELFKFPFVKSVFIAGNYVTIFKDDKLDWNDITLELREFLREYLSSGKLIVLPNSNQSLPKAEDEFPNPQTGKGDTDNQVEHTIPQTEVEQKIIATLEQYIRPAVEQDGGMIVFKSFKDGVVTLLMRGACSGCPSSTVTLKAGIQAMLKKFIPEVTEVVSE